MRKCDDCGHENPDDLQSCANCGAALPAETEADQECSLGEEIGEKIEKSAEDFGMRVSAWWDRTFGIVGPAISALLQVAMLIIVFFIISVIFGSSQAWIDLMDFFVTYFPWILGLVLFYTYLNYFAKKHEELKWFVPVLNIPGFVVGTWLFVIVMRILAEDLEIDFFGSIADFFDNYIVILIILVVLLWYVGLILSTIVPKLTPPKEGGCE